MPRNTKLTSQKQETGRVIPKFIIYFTPPSSPEISDSDFELDSDEEIEELSLDGSDDASTSGTCVTLSTTATSNASNASQASSQTSCSPLSPVVKDFAPLTPHAQLLAQYTTAKISHQPDALVADTRQSVLNHLHSNPVIFNDLQFLIPTYTYDYGLTNKLAHNIGYHTAGGRISELDKVAMLELIFNAGDDYYDLYQRVHERIKTSKEAIAPKPGSKRWHQEQQQKQVEEMRELQERLENEEEMASRIAEFPESMRAPATESTLPIGVTSVAEMYVQNFGLSWGDVKKSSSDEGHPQEQQVMVTVPVFSSPPEDGMFFAFTKPILTHTETAKENCAQVKIKLPPKAASTSALSCLASRNLKLSKRTKARELVANRPTASHYDLFVRAEGEPTGGEDRAEAPVQLP
ncbi:hypothetical protein BU23DRAFT_599542 [Bimuria novae-zelandiae CBS 107.79]|uniref:Uncharacterized protein n=1 Tax=Bimuria novae-zelandiae CBS 107.79 TaxID=1447943 RepID=A0A6A5V5U6_9PLEO|nr:hypothetical protein BU23DRAFT_599542 [Bimuria novae-zelandiae CBS 107.79]